MSAERYTEYRLTWEWLNPNFMGTGPAWFDAEIVSKKPLLPEDVTTRGHEVRNIKVAFREVEIVTHVTEWEYLD